jgi:conjugative transfer signal peptidase TraF
MNPE